MRDRIERIPIFFVTGHGDVPMAVHAVKRGAIDFLEKPFKDDELLSRIASAVRFYQGLLETGHGSGGWHRGLPLSRIASAR